MNQSIITNSPIFHLLFPHTCIGCGSDTLSADSFLCLECIVDLPHTHFANHRNNPVEKIFWGRVPVEAGMAELYTRWMQFGVFNPLSRAHHEGDNAVEPWMFGEVAERNSKKAIELSYPVDYHR